MYMHIKLIFLFAKLIARISAIGFITQGQLSVTNLYCSESLLHTCMQVHTHTHNAPHHTQYNIIIKFNNQEFKKKL